MSEIKCLACPHLARRTFQRKGGHLEVVFACSQGRFPYQAALSGLLKPSLGIAQAAQNCPQLDWGRCLVCRRPGEVRLGRGFRIALCQEHDRAWGSWLLDHPEKRGYFKPHNRPIYSRWLEVFWEFVAGARGSVKVRARDRE